MYPSYTIPKKRTVYFICISQKTISNEVFHITYNLTYNRKTLSYYTVSGNCQSIGVSPNAISASLVLEKGLEPRNPR